MSLGKAILELITSEMPQSFTVSPCLSSHHTIPIRPSEYMAHCRRYVESSAAVLNFRRVSAFRDEVSAARIKNIYFLEMCDSMDN